MQRRERAQPINLHFDLLINANRVLECIAAMHDAMTDGGQVIQSVLGFEFLQALRGC